MAESIYLKIHTCHVYSTLTILEVRREETRERDNPDKQDIHTYMYMTKRLCPRDIDVLQSDLLAMWRWHVREGIVEEGDIGHDSLLIWLLHMDVCRGMWGGREDERGRKEGVGRRDGGREGEREGGREGWMEGGREGGWEGERKGDRGKEGRREGRREGGREGGKEGRREGEREGGREGGGEREGGRERERGR